jgi:hypothetical protein
MPIDRPITSRRTLARKQVITKTIANNYRYTNKSLLTNLRTKPKLSDTEFKKVINSKPLEFKVDKLKYPVFKNTKIALTQLGKLLQIRLDLKLYDAIYFSPNSSRGFYLSDFVNHEPIKEIVKELNDFDPYLGQQAIGYIKSRLRIVFNRSF